MNERDIATKQSFKEVSGVIKRKADDFAGFTSVGEDVIILDGLIADIDKQNEILETSTKGYTDTKNASKFDVITVKLRPVSTRLLAYARKNKLDVLYNEINFTEKALLKRADKRLADVLRLYVKNARKFITEMASLGLIEAMIVALEEGIADFEAKRMGTPQYQGEQKAANQRIDKDMAEGKDLLETSIDPILEIMRDDYPDTYAEYQNARKIKFPPRRTVALKIKVYQSGTLVPISGVTITITPDTSGNEMKSSADLVKSVKRSSKQGGCQEKNMPDGKCIITAEKPGLETKTTIAYINSGQTCKVIIEMSPLP